MDQSSGPGLRHLDQTLPGHRALKIERARGVRVVCVAGEVWITEDGRQDDVVLAAGGSTVLERAGLAIITPFGPADVEIEWPDREATATAHAYPFAWLRARLRPAARRDCGA